MKPILSLIFLLIVQATAQIDVFTKPVKEQFVSHEQVFVDLSLASNIGRNVTLKGSGLDNWLNINVYDQRGNLIPYRAGAPTFKAVVLPVGDTIKKRINLSQYYDLTRHGRFSYNISVRLPGTSDQVARSATDHFLITSARVIATRKVGIPGTVTARTYEVMRHNGNKRSTIYIKITNNYNNRVVACSVLSPVVNTKPPKFAVDANNDLHLLYLVTNSTYVHHIITPTGKIKLRSYHKPGSYEDPRLLTFAKGDVKVAGTIPFDPRAAIKEAEKDRKLSDRPTF